MRRASLSNVRPPPFLEGKNKSETVSLVSNLLVDEEDEGEGHGAPQAAVHHDELVHHLELVQPVVVGDGGEQDHAWKRTGKKSISKTRGRCVLNPR